MAGLLEVAAKIAADKEQVTQLAAMLAAAKDQAEQTAGTLSGLGVDRAAAQTQHAATVIEEAESLRAALEGGLQKAHWQVMSAAHGRMGPGAKGSGAIVPLGKAEDADGAPRGGLDAVPPHLRHGSNPSGEELSGIEPSIGPFQKEHEGASDDAGKSKSKRLGRKFVQNAGDLADSAKQSASNSTFEIEDDFDPWGSQAQATVEVPTGQPPVYVSRIEADDIKVGDVLSTTIVVAAFAIEAVTRRTRKKDNG